MKFAFCRIIENEISYFHPVNPKLHKHINDQELLERFYADHDNQWLGILLERYTLLLLGVCMKYLKNEELARDSVQQIFLKAITELQKYRVEYFKSWIYMVAKNHCLMQLRNKPGKNTVEVKDSIPAETDETDKESLLLNEKTYEFMGEALKELNTDQQLCVTLFYMEKKSYQQIAEQTGYSMMQVKSHIQNGKRNMRILIEKKMSG
ncbi:MAG TPA: sigma-70 family RNA polymerase sigma factor [Chitinophagaceae bacterium]|nr:sigma-70 family RNA polymerase sigma factor [Chitinophagaceae bacterium]